LAELQEIVTLLSDGELIAPAPFDAATSAALASNLDRGDIAERLFDITAQREPTYQVHIVEVSAGVTREVLNTTADSSRTLFALLDGLMDEIAARRHP
jgi:dethiobiotin synthetase